MCNTEALPEPTTDSPKSIVENPGLAEILPAHIKDPKNEKTLSVMSSEQQPGIPKIACRVTGCARTFNKQYELKFVGPYPFPMRDANRP
jgi:hypothetical protein